VAARAVKAGEVVMAEAKAREEREERLIKQSEERAERELKVGGRFSQHCQGSETTLYYVCLHTFVHTHTSLGGPV
jgi:hypothetical protein